MRLHNNAQRRVAAALDLRPIASRPQVREALDRFLGVRRPKPAQQSAPAPQTAAVTQAYADSLSRAPTAEELNKGIAFAASLESQGKSPEEVAAALHFVIAMSPEWQGRESYREVLGRDPSAEELSKTQTWGAQLQAQGKSVPEMRGAFDFVLKMTPEWQGKESYRAVLGRDPSADELSKTMAWGAQLQAQGKSVEEMRGGFDFVLKMTPEWQAKDAYQTSLGRAPNPDELQQMKGLGDQWLAEGKSVEEMRAGFNYVIGISPEWQAAHQSKMNIDRDAIYLQQPNGWSCGPTSLTMALAAAGVRSPDLGTMFDLAGQLGARAGVGTPGGVSLIADVARRNGVNAESSSSTDPADMRAALERGHGIVVNGDIGGGGHFIYIAGLDMAGNYIVCDPYRPGITSWNDDDLNAFTHHGNNPPGFAEIWPS